MYVVDSAREQLRAYKHRKEIPIGTRFFWWPTEKEHMTSGSLPYSYMWSPKHPRKTQILKVCKIYTGHNGYGPFVDYWLNEDGTDPGEDPRDCMIVNGPDTFRLTRVPDTIPEFSEEAVLYKMSRMHCDIMDGWRNIVSSTDLMRWFFVTRYQARKMLHSLEDQELIHKDEYSGMTDDGSVFCYHGYVISRKTKDSKIFRKAAYDEAKLAAECFSSGGHDMPGYYHSMF